MLAHGAPRGKSAPVPPDADSAPPVSRVARLRAFYPRDLAMALLVLLGLSLPFWRLTSPDFFWHVKTGELIVRNLAPPTSDVFSFTNEGKHWVDHEWLSQLFMYGLYGAAGYAGSALVFAAIGLVSVLVGYQLMRRLNVPEVLALGLTALGIVLGFEFWIVRPAPISAALLGLVYYNCYLFRRGRARSLWPVVPLMVLWANVHGGYVLGLVLVGLLVVAELIAGGLAGPRFRHAARVGVIAFLVTGLNPYTYELWLYPFTYFVGDNHSIAIVSEWQAPQLFHSLGSIPLGVTILAFVALGASSGKADLWRIGVALLFTFFALQSARHQLFFAVVIPPLLGDLVAERWPGLLELPRRPISALLSFANLAAVVLVAAITVQTVATLGFQTGDTPKLNAAALPFPVDGANFISRNYPQSRVFNEYAWGGYLIYENWPEMKVFIDGRADLHGDLLAEYEVVWAGRPGWDRILDRYSIDAVIFGSNSDLARLLRSDARWEEAFIGPYESVFVRAGE